MVENKISLFVKPWMHLSPKDLILKIQELGFHYIEYPVRNGCYINPENCEQELPKFQRMLNQEGIYISSIAGVADERLFSAMSRSDIFLLREMLYYARKENYLEAEQRFVREMDKSARYCEKYGTKVGIQPHEGQYVSNTMELRHLLEQCNSDYIGAVWDIGHSGLAGESATKALDIIYDYILQVNLKAAYYEKNVNAEGIISYKPHYTTGSESPCKWKEAFCSLEKRGYQGMYCACAEYSDVENTENYLRLDSAHEEVAKRL